MRLRLCPRVLTAAGLVVGLTLPLPAGPADAAAPRRAKVSLEFRGTEDVLRWIHAYRATPQADRLPVAIKALSTAGAFKEAETTGLYVGFAGGVLARQPQRAEALLAAMFPLPPEDHLIVIKAVAYSGLPNWQALLRGIAERMPARAAVVDRYLTGRLPTLDALALDGGPQGLDALWGRYYATGDFEPLLRILSILHWSKDGNNRERLTIGSMAKWTLASNAARDMDLLGQLKRALPAEPKPTQATLREVIEAAEIGEIGRIRTEALTAIETLKVRGSEKLQSYRWWGEAGQTALALGCITASALGQAAVGVPCVIGGALSSAALKAFQPKE
jgi:hypothetical protein